MEQIIDIKQGSALAVPQAHRQLTVVFELLENLTFCIKLPAGLSLRFQVAGHMKLVGGVPSVKVAIT